MKSKKELLEEAVEALESFCAGTACPECEIRKLCNRADKELPLSEVIKRAVELN